MTYETALELTGYFASILILISLLMSSAVKLRVINAVGSAIFTVYALLIRSYPTAFLNGVSLLVNIYHLCRLLRSHTQFAAHTARPDDNGLQEFLRFYRNDIGHHFPTYDFRIEPDDLIILVYADACPVGLFIGKRQENGVLRVLLDYSIPKYRDCSVGKFLYGELQVSGVRELITAGGTQDHEVYLKKVGFQPRENQYIKVLN